MSSYAYYNGKFGHLSEISIPLTDRAIYFGDGIYDAAIGINGGIFLLDEHVSRLLGNADKIKLKHQFTQEKLEQILKETVIRSGISDFFLYFQLTRDGKIRTHSALECESANLLVTVKDLTLGKSDELLDLITFEDKRYRYCDIKTLNLLPSVLASTEAERHGCAEAVFHRGNTVTECAHSNVSILKSGKLITHPTDDKILPGITRRHLLMGCDKVGIPYEERAFSLDELFDADEILVTSTSKLCARAGRIDGKIVGGRDKKNALALYEYLLNELYEFGRQQKRG